MHTRKFRQPGILTGESLPCQTHPHARILMVDDNSYRGELGAEVLRQHGYAVTTARDGETGWAELQANHYHLLITENDLPGLTGVGLVKKLRAAGMLLPVITVTAALPAWESPEYSWLLKANKLLRPYSIEDLLGMVKQVLRPTASVRAQSRTPANRQSQTAVDRLRL